MNKAPNRGDPGGEGNVPKKRSAPKKGKTLKLRLTARVKSDNADALKVVREALRQFGRPLRIFEVSESPETVAPGLPTDPPPAKDVKLSVEVAESVRIHLDIKASQSQPSVANAEESEGIKKRLLKWLAEKAKAGWRVTVLAVLEWLTAGKQTE